ncbi:MAG TPA: antitoxin [Acidimicrobiales bacterium]
MGILDDMKDKAAGLVGGHAEQVDQGIDKAVEVIDDKTGGGHTEQIEGAADKAKDVLGGLGDDQS